jgi:hypothetical protein
MRIESQRMDSPQATNCLDAFTADVENACAPILRAIASKGPSMLADRNRTKFPEFRKSDVDLNNGG